MIFNNLRNSSTLNDADKGHQVSRHSSPEKSLNMSPTSERISSGKKVPTGRQSQQSFGLSGSTKEKEASRHRRTGSKKYKMKSGSSRVQKYLDLNRPSMKQTLALFKEKLGKEDLWVLLEMVQNKRAHNKELESKVEEAEQMLQHAESRGKKKKTSKLYRKRTMGTMRKVDSMKGKSRRGKAVLEDIIKEDSRNDQLQERAREAMKKFVQKLKAGQIASNKDSELEKVLQLRRTARKAGVDLFGKNVEDQDVREMWERGQYEVFKTKKNGANRSVLMREESLDRIDEIDVGKSKNKSVNLGRRGMGRKSSRVMTNTRKVLTGELGKSRFWKTTKEKPKKRWRGDKKKSKPRERAALGRSTLKGAKSRKKIERGKSRGKTKQNKKELARSISRLIGGPKKLKKSLLKSKVGKKKAKSRRKVKKEREKKPRLEELAIGFESFKGKEVQEEAARERSRSRSTKKSSREERGSKADERVKRVKLYSNKVRKSKKRDSLDQAGAGKKPKSKRPRSKSKGKRMKKILESQILGGFKLKGSQKFNASLGSLLNSKMSLLSRQASRKKIAPKSRKAIQKSSKKRSRAKPKKKKGAKKKAKGKFASANTKRKKTGKKRRTGKSSERLTNSDFRMSTLAGGDSMLIGEADVEVENGKLVVTRSSRGQLRESSADVRKEEGQRRVGQSVDALRAKTKKNQLVDYRAKPMSLLRKLILGGNDQFYLVREETREMKVEDEDDRADARGGSLRLKLGDTKMIRNWEEELVSAEHNFEQNLFRNSDKMIDTERINEELKKLEQMERSFELEKKKQITRFEQEKAQIIQREKERGQEDESLCNIIKFNPNGGNWAMSGKTGEELQKMAMETQIQNRLRAFDGKRLQCASEMVISEKVKSQINEKLVEIGREGLKMTESNQKKIMNHLLGKVKQGQNKASAKQLELGNNVKNIMLKFPIANVNWAQQERETLGIEAKQMPRFGKKVESFYLKDLEGGNDPFLRADITEEVLMGSPNQFGVKKEPELDIKNCQKIKSGINIKTKEVIIRRLEQSGVRYPLKGNKQSQRGIRTIESTLNSIPDSLRKLF